MAWVGPEPKIGTGERGAAVALYLAMVTAECLTNIGHDGKIIVEGPFAGNQLYLEMLAVASGSSVDCAKGSTGTSAGAAMLAGGMALPQPAHDRPGTSYSEKTDSLQNYASNWRQSTRRRSQ